MRLDRVIYIHWFIFNGVRLLPYAFIARIRCAWSRWWRHSSTSDTCKYTLLRWRRGHRQSDIRYTSRTSTAHLSSARIHWKRNHMQKLWRCLFKKKNNASHFFSFPLKIASDWLEPHDEWEVSSDVDTGCEDVDCVRAQYFIAKAEYLWLYWKNGFIVLEHIYLD